jgi:hypothetical protein
MRCHIVVRELPAAVIVSVVAHAAALIFLVSAEEEPAVVVAVQREPPPLAPQPEPPMPASAPLDPPPIEVVFLDERAAATAQTTLDLPPLSALLPARRPGSHETAVSTSSTTATAETSTTGATGTSGTPDPRGAEPGRSPLMTMRRPELAGLSATFLDDLASRTKPAEPIPDLPGARIDAEIADIRARLRNPNRDHTADRARLVELNEARKQVELKPDGGGRYKSNKTTFVAKIDPDGKAHLKDKANLQWHGLGATFDVTDWAMRSSGIDPYAREKLKFLDRTRGQRVAIGREHRREVLSHSAQIMDRNIARLWATTPDLHARKQSLFDLWDECAETGFPELVAGGTDARKALTDFIKAKLTGADAYTPDELTHLNRQRRSKASFAPYE